MTCFFWKPISKLVTWQIFRKFGHFLTDIHGLEIWVWNSYRHFFKYWPFSVKVVPISLILTKSNNPNTHFGAFFMLYTNQITKIRKYFFWPNPTLTKWPIGRVVGLKLKHFFSPSLRGYIFLNTWKTKNCPIFLIFDQN